MLSLKHNNTHSPPHKIWNTGNDQDNKHNIWPLGGESYQELFYCLMCKPVPETDPQLNVIPQNRKILVCMALFLLFTFI
jgi:hypothetical protein